jgi:anti-anti-sigma factor
MAGAVPIITVQREGDALILTPERDLRELEYQEIEAEADELLRRLAADLSIRHVVADLGKTGYFGSTALGLFTQLHQQLRQRNGQMALCNLSADEGEILNVAGLVPLLPAYPSREAALAAVSR